MVDGELTSRSNKPASTCKAWSLKERVGPQNSSKTYRSPRPTTGATTSGTNLEAASMTNGPTCSAPNSVRVAVTAC